MNSPEDGPLAIVTEEALRMSRLSPLGLEVQTSKLRITNPDLKRYLVGITPLADTLIAPFYGLILLEYELRRRRIPSVTPATVREFEGQEQDEDVTESESTFRTLLTRDRQSVLLSASEAYLNSIRASNVNLGLAAQFLVADTYTLLRMQALQDQK